MAKQFIVFEGIDGAGTTTQSKLLANYYQNQSFWDKEPTDGDFGKIIQKILKEKKEINPITLLQLFLADRAEHQKIIKEKKQKEHVILDRYLLSSLAYQGLCFDQEDLYQLNANFTKPDIIFFMDIDPQEGLARKKENKELFEEVPILNKVREKYFTAIDLLQQQGWQIEFIDASKNIKDIHQEIIKKLEGV